jgi:hypothetical protein
MNKDYDFDSNNQDDVIFNGVDGIHSIDEFNIVFESLSDTLDVVDLENNEVYYEW